MKKIGLIMMGLLYGITCIHGVAFINNDSLALKKDTLQLDINSFLHNKSLANTDGYMPSVIHPSPQVALFQNYLSYEMDESRGTANVSIPIYDIQVDGVTIPIALSYQTSGIKYKQYDGEVGVGWVLSCNFNASRTIMGKLDESYSIPLNVESLLYNYDAKEGYIKDRFLAAFYLMNPEQNNPNPNIEGNIRNDGAYDQFSYYLPSTKGDFIITDPVTKKVDTYSRNNDLINLDITKTTNYDITHLIEGLNIKDDKGNTYLLGKSLSGKIISEGAIATVGSTMWPLMDIVTKNKQNIKFDYNEARVNTKDLTHNEFSIIDAYTPFVYDVKEETVFQSIGIQGTNMLMQFLEKITTDKEIILFRRERQPYGALQIASIEIIDRLTNTTIKKITCKYKYEEPHNLLESVTISDSKNILSEVYKMEYIQGSFDYLYPDQWGYYCSGKDPKYKSATVLHKEFENHVYWNGTVYRPITGAFATPHIIFSPIFLERGYNRNAEFYSLKKITFPTGGSRSFEYESNKYGISREGCGIRIKKIISDDADGNKITKLYKYGANEDGLGHISYPLSAKQFGEESLDIKLEFDGSRMGYTPRLVRSFSSLPKGDISLDQIYVAYGMLTVYEEKSDQPKYNGKVVTTYGNCWVYDILPDMGNYNATYKIRNDRSKSNNNEGAYVHMYAKGEKQPLITSRTYYDNNRKIKDEVYDHIRTNNNKTLTGLKIEEKVTTNWFDSYYHPNTTINQGVHPYLYTSSFYNYMTYRIELGSWLIDSKITTEYFDNTTICTSEKYEYNNKNQLEKTIKTNSASNRELIQEYIYPVANNSFLVQKNIISTPIETITSNNGVEIGRVKYIYPNSSIVPASLNVSFRGKDKGDEFISFDRYDSKNNLVQYRKSDNIPIIYLYSYKGQYPIAEIKNAIYADVETAAKSAFGVSSVDALSNLSSVPVSQLNNLRNHALLEDAQITTYTYKPLVGMTSMTDPSGKTTFYDYDNFGRLGTVSLANKSKEKDLLETYQYHYAKLTEETPKPEYSTISLSGINTRSYDIIAYGNAWIDLPEDADVTFQLTRVVSSAKGASAYVNIGGQNISLTGDNNGRYTFALKRGINSISVTITDGYLTSGQHDEVILSLVGIGISYVRVGEPSSFTTKFIDQQE